MNRLNPIVASLLLCASLRGQGIRQQTPASPAAPPNIKPVDVKPADVKPADVKSEAKCSIECTLVSATTGETLKKAHFTMRPMGQQNGIPVEPPRTVRAISSLTMSTPADTLSLRSETVLCPRLIRRRAASVFKLTPQGVITGHVVDQDGEPLSPRPGSADEVCL